jgi:hypothetical protein
MPFHGIKSATLKIIGISCFLLIFLGCSVKATDVPTTEWNRTYGAISSVVAFSTSDGGVAIAGTTGDWVTASRGGGSWTNNTLTLTKTNSAGEVQWTKNYTRGNLQSATLTSDGGYALAGTGEDSLIKTDSQGNMQWSMKYSAFDGASVSSVIQAQDGGFVVAGHGDQPVSGTEGRLVKTDSNGNVQWSKTYGVESEIMFVRSVMETGDGGYALAGSTTYLDAGGGDALLLKVDSSGNVQWEKTYGGTGGDEADSLTNTGDGGYLLVGETHSFGANNQNGWVVKTDSQGNMQWDKTYDAIGARYFSDAVQVDYDAYVLTGVISDTQGSVVVKLSGSGDLEWQKNYAGDNRINSVTETLDGGYVFAGYRDGGGQNSAVWAVKIAPDSSPQETTPPPSESPWISPIDANIAIAVIIAGVGATLILSAVIYRRYRRS